MYIHFGDLELRPDTNRLLGILSEKAGHYTRNFDTVVCRRCKPWLILLGYAAAVRASVVKCLFGMCVVAIGHQLQKWLFWDVNIHNPGMYKGGLFSHELSDFRSY